MCATKSATLLQRALKLLRPGAGCAVLWAGVIWLGLPAAGQSVYSQAYTFTTLAGSAPSLGSADGVGNNARFFNPRGIAIDGLGNLYVADTENDIIRKVTEAGVVSTVAGLTGVPGSADGTNSGALFNLPQGMAVDPQGNVYVGDDGCTIRNSNFRGTIGW